jgi:hypothetical protein
MSVVWSCNEWDPLEEVIVGNPLGARFPYADPSTQLAEFPDRALKDIPQGAFPQQIIEETEEDLDAFVSVLEGLGITVKRPETWPHEKRFSTVHWESEGYYNYCPRDIMLVIGDQIIETPNVIRSQAQRILVFIGSINPRCRIKQVGDRKGCQKQTGQKQKYPIARIPKRDQDQTKNRIFHQNIAVEQQGVRHSDSEQNDQAPEGKPQRTTGSRYHSAHLPCKPQSKQQRKKPQ